MRPGNPDGELTHAQDVGGALGDADAAARVEDVEQVRALQAVLERRQDQVRRQQLLAKLEVPVEQLPMTRAELAEAQAVDLTEHILRLLDLFLQADLAILHTAAPLQVEHVVDLLQEHRDALEAIGDLAGNRCEIHSAHLLEVRELRDLHAVEHHLPADAPRAERRRLPVVLLEADVVQARIDAARLEAFEVELLYLVRRRFEDHLILVMLEQAVRVLSKASIIGAPRRLHVGHAPRLGAEDAEQRLGMGCARADLEVERLLQQTPVRGPVRRQLEDEVLKRHAILNPARRDGEDRAALGPISTSSPDAWRSAPDARSPAPARPVVRQARCRLAAARPYAIPPGTPSRHPTAFPAIPDTHPATAGANIRSTSPAARPGFRPPAHRASRPRDDRADRRRRPPVPTRRAAPRSNSHTRARPANSATAVNAPSPCSSDRPAPAAPSRSTPPAPR